MTTFFISFQILINSLVKELSLYIKKIVIMIFALVQLQIMIVSLVCM